MVVRSFTLALAACALVGAAPFITEQTEFDGVPFENATKYKIVTLAARSLRDAKAKSATMKETKRSSAETRRKYTIPVVKLILDQDLMVETFGFASAPIYAISIKGYFNFFVGMALLMGLKLIAVAMCPCCCTPQHYHAVSGKEVLQTGGSMLLPVSAEQHEEYDREGCWTPLHVGHILFPGPCLLDHEKAHIKKTPITFKVDVEGSFEYANATFRNFLQWHDWLGDPKDPQFPMLVAEPESHWNYETGFERLLVPSSMLPQSRSYLLTPIELEDSTYIETVSSAFLARFSLKPLSIGFQAVGVLTSAYSVFVMCRSIPLEDWADVQLFAYLSSQHNSSITLTVAVAQTLVLVIYSQTGRDKLIAKALFAMSAFVGLPVAMAAIAVGWYGALLFFLLPALLGTALIPLVAFCMVVADVPISLNFVPTTFAVAYDDARDGEICERYSSMGLMNKTWYFLTYLLPKTATFNGYRFLLVVVLMMVALMAVPLCWLGISGWKAAPVACAFLFEVMLPLLGIISFSVAKLAMGQGQNMGRAGMVMVLGFVIAQIILSLASVILPASILLTDPSVHISDALPVAFTNRHGTSYARGIALAVSSLVSRQEKIHKDVSWAKYSLHQARLALTQFLSLIS